MRTEVLIVAVTLVAASALIGGTAGVLHQLAPHDRRRVTLRARYRRGRHNHPSLLARLGAALLHGWRELAAAHSLMTGGQPWQAV